MFRLSDFFLCHRLALLLLFPASASSFSSFCLGLVPPTTHTPLPPLAFYQDRKKKRGLGARGQERTGERDRLLCSAWYVSTGTIGGKKQLKNTVQLTSCKTKASLSLPPEGEPKRKRAEGRKRERGRTREREPGPEEPAPEREEARSRRRRYRHPRELHPTIARVRAPRRAKSRR